MLSLQDLAEQLQKKRELTQQSLNARKGDVKKVNRKLRQSKGGFS